MIRSSTSSMTRPVPGIFSSNVADQVIRVPVSSAVQCTSAR